MFFDDLAKIPELAKNSGFSIFVTPKMPDLKLKNSYTVTPDDSGKITIDAVREVISLCNTKQTKPFYVVFRNAETMNEQAENALLKLLEEPLENYHFILLVKSASALLPTILSRGTLYIQRIKNPLKAPVNTTPDQRLYAKRIIAAKNSELPGIVNDMANEKDYKKDPRGFALGVAETAVEILYKSYFHTKNLAFLRKLPRFLTLYENLKQNGHIKLHFVADMI